MAEHAHTTSAPASPHPIIPRRRLLAAFAGSACIAPASAAPQTHNGEAALLAYYRGLDAARQAAVLGSMEIAAAAKPAAGTADAKLLATIAAFDALERDVNATYDTCADSIEAEEAADLAREPLQARQAPLLSRICTLRATTMAGCSARARSLMLWDSKQAAAVEAGDLPDDYWNDRMVIALLRDLTQGALA